MKLYNTLGRKTEEFKPLSADKVTVYTCGPTVYDYPHVGNWFTFIRYDLLIRTLRLNGYNPEWVINITDVGHLVSDADEGEDKLEKGARREGKTAWEIAKFYSDYFMEGLKRLNFVNPDQSPKATDHIEEQIALVKVLEEKGFTYTISDGVYFDASKFENYAEFAQLDLDEQQAGARVDYNREKRGPNDFALWKFSPKDKQRDMEWDSPWGKGFPGWHLECSAMCLKYFGPTIDIHSGGIDHIPVHHTNEIAQSESANGKPLAKIWMHSNHITIEGQKIAKSEGNGITLEEIESKGISLQALRLHVLESHYRSQSKFSWESLEAAQNRLKSYQALADLRWQNIPGKTDDSLTKLLTVDLPNRVKESLAEDLDTPQVLYFLSTAEPEIINHYTSEAGEALVNFIKTYVDDALGLQLLNSQDISDQQKEQINDREKARNQQDWQKADELRNALIDQGIALRDTGSGAVWYRA